MNDLKYKIYKTFPTINYLQSCLPFGFKIILLNLKRNDLFIYFSLNQRKLIINGIVTHKSPSHDTF